MSQAIGLLGAAIIVIAWLPATLDTIKKRKSKVNLFFTFLYFIGATLLTWYAILIKDVPFMFLNSLAAIMAMVNLYYVSDQEESKQLKRLKKTIGLN